MWSAQGKAICAPAGYGLASRIMNKLHYLAYGSNLHPVRLTKRVPSAALIGKVELSQTRLAFYKRSIDGSGKCTLLQDTISKSIAYGALYTMASDEVVLLDGFEGLAKGYDKHAISCDIDNTIYHAFTYLAAPQAIDVSLKPYHWYKQLVLAGARHHCFPESYIAYLEGIDSIPDPDPERMIMNEGLLEEIERFS